MSQALYHVGIDLGTTHSVIAYKDKSDQNNGVQLLPIAQLTAPGQVEEPLQLGSFVYQAHHHELGEGSRTLPWTTEPEALVGTIARNMGAKSPTRLVSSAKSWLCHAGVNRRDAILPAGSPEDVEKISPLRATELYLTHLHDAWNHRFPNAPISEQDVTITVPASFDPAARELTAEAARSIGFEHLTLLEEPQAALYSWLNLAADNWREQLETGDTILVVDVGGGTTDLSLVAVNDDDGNLSLERIAVGEHILLGGDNMDLALAYQVKAKLAAIGKEIQPWQIQAITQACRDAKETLLADNDIESVPIVVPSRGSKLLGTTLKCELTRHEVTQFLVEGFFPNVSIDNQPQQARRGALTQMGLPYAQDPAITKHISGFLSKHGENAEQTNDPFASMISNPMLGGQPIEADASASFRAPTAILFNGGVLKSDRLRTRLLETINQWLTEANKPHLKVLTGTNLDLAVAHGAAYYSEVRQGDGVRIRGGISSSFYIGVESALPAIPGMAPPMEAYCIAPFGLEEGSEAVMPKKEFGLVVGEPVHFQFFGSTARQHDQAGDLLDHWADGELDELPEVHLTLSADNGRQPGDIVPVTLRSSVDELGTLQLQAIASDNQEAWRVDFDLRAEQE
ncbi:molecular chaperone DnaK [Vibrio sp. qd031]|uniref:Hsp70 family protein n=1 Tax=Vibrio sp. qd031 TaxID=1603038 RepID=UPI000A0F6842|nr:Hsp70 family protein [Vibrio sp. qd031]ORT49693.1 molecular chaperone DnaK [Vibrio sp. qd031]